MLYKALLLLLAELPIIILTDFPSIDSDYKNKFRTTPSTGTLTTLKKLLLFNNRLAA